MRGVARSATTTLLSLIGPLLRRASLTRASVSGVDSAKESQALFYSIPRAHPPVETVQTQERTPKHSHRLSGNQSIQPVLDYLE